MNFTAIAPFLFHVIECIDDDIRVHMAVIRQKGTDIAEQGINLLRPVVPGQQIVAKTIEGRVIDDGTYRVAGRDMVIVRMLVQNICLSIRLLHRFLAGNCVVAGEQRNHETDKKQRCCKSSMQAPGYHRLFAVMRISDMFHPGNSGTILRLGYCHMG